MSDLLRRRALMAQSRGKSMQLLAEYTVTEPVTSFTIPLTDQMKSCAVMYCAIDLSFSTSDYLYIGFAGGNTANSWFGSASSVSSNVTIFHADQVTIGETTFPTRWIMYSPANGSTPKKSGSAPEFIRCYMYLASTLITAGTVKIYGEV